MTCAVIQSQLVAYLQQELPAAEQAAWAAHLATCPDCQAELHSTQRVWQALGQVAVPEPSARLRPLTATSPEQLGAGLPDPARLSARLTDRGKELGAIDVVDRGGREYSPRDRAILDQLANLASVAISNARLYDRERTIARTLQRSLRPGALPAVPGLAAAVRFRPAGENIELGGDFYDAFRIAGGWMVVEHDPRESLPDRAGGLVKVDARRYGDTALSFYRPVVEGKGETP